MCKLYIPQLSDSIFLLKDWSFKLTRERRTYSFWKAYEDLMKSQSIEPIIEEVLKYNAARKFSYVESYTMCVTIPKTTELIVRRIYIRRGSRDYSSVTFTIGKSCSIKQLRGKRFWARLDDVNNIEYKPDCSTIQLNTLTKLLDNSDVLISVKE